MNALKKDLHSTVASQDKKPVVLKSTDFTCQEEREARKRELLRINPQNSVIMVNIVDGSRGPDEPTITRWKE